jgi:hypothetical protein
MKVVVTGEGAFTPEDLVEAFDHYEIKPSVLLSAGDTTLEKAAEAWAKENDVVVDSRQPKWNDLTVEKCSPRDGKYGQYNARAAFNRNDELVEDCDCVLVVSEATRTSTSIVESAEKLEKDVYNWPKIEGDDVPF